MVVSVFHQIGLNPQITETRQQHHQLLWRNRRVWSKYNPNPCLPGSKNCLWKSTNWRFPQTSRFFFFIRSKMGFHLQRQHPCWELALVPVMKM